MHKKCILCFVIFALIVGLSSSANAERSMKTTGVWISGSADAIGKYWNTASPGSFTTKTTYATLGMTGSHVGIGYQFGEHFLLGLRFGFVTVLPDRGSSITAGTGVAHIEIPFLTGKVRPFILLEPGIISAGASGLSIGSNTHTGFVGHFGGGVHLFATDSFSISPYGALGYQTLPDINSDTVSLTIGALFSGWVWR